MSITPQPTLRLKFWNQIKPLFEWNDHKRPLGYLMVAALAVGMPAFFAAWLGEFSAGMLGCMGSLIILYMRQTNISHRMMTLTTCAFGFSLSFALGVLTSFDPYLSAFTLLLTVFLATTICRFYSVPPPGSFFFIVAACLARTLPFDISLTAERTGVLMFGSMWACLLALSYSFLQKFFSKSTEIKPSEVEDHYIFAISIESAVISVFVGGGYLLALLTNLENPYWVPISTAAIMQGATFRAIWQRNVHRIFGTVIGMALAWMIFSLAPGPWALAGLILILTFIIELLITRNYGLAVIFITPLTVIFAEATVATAEPNQLILSRIFDIALGSFIGYIGGWIIHHPRFVQTVQKWTALR